LFSGGLNTEISDLEDAAPYTSDESNCAFLTSGARVRRLGIDFEENFSFLPSVDLDINDEYACAATEWTCYKESPVYIGSVESLKKKTNAYIVVQYGGSLYFYKNYGPPFSQEASDFVLDLAEYRLDPESDAYKTETCRFTQAYGGLFVCSKAIQPILITALEKPQQSNTSSIRKQYMQVSLGPWENQNSVREYDPVVEMSFGGSILVHSRLFGNNMRGEGRGVVLNSEGNKVGKVPSWNAGTVYSIYDSTKIGTVRGDSAYADDGSYLGSVHGCDDFYTPFSQIPGAYSASNKIVNKPTAHYYAKVWNEGDGVRASAKSVTGLTAYAVTPYDSEWSFKINWDGKNEIVREVPGVSEKFVFKKEEGRLEYCYKEFLVLVGETALQKDLSVRTWSYTDKVSHRDLRYSERFGKYSALYAYTMMQGLTLRVRDFQGVEDLYEGADLRLGDNVSVTPATLTDAHKYNLYNQGWDGIVSVDTDNDGVNDRRMGLIESFYKDTSDSEDFTACYPANNMQWFVAKDTTTRSFTSGNIWAGNSFTRYRPLNLLQYAFGNTPAPKGHYIINYFKPNREEVSSVKVAGDPPRVQYVSDIITYAGRVFYLSGDTVLYSQVVLEDLTKAGNCYQEADPTSEEMSDIVDTDGGVLQIPEIGEGIRFARLGGVLAVIGTKTTYLIAGGSNKGFTATAYTSGSLQSYTSKSYNSFVEAENSVFYWSPVGIIQLANTNAGVVANVVSHNSIQKLYDNLSETAKENCVGFYDFVAKEIWWLYPGDDKNPKRKTKALVYCFKNNAWTKMSFAEKASSIAELPYVSGGFALDEAFVVDPKTYIYTETDDGTLQPVVAGGVEGEGLFYLNDGTFLGDFSKGVPEPVEVPSSSNLAGYTVSWEKTKNDSTSVYPYDGTYVRRLQMSGASFETSLTFHVIQNSIWRIDVEHGTSEKVGYVLTDLRTISADTPVEKRTEHNRSSLFLCVDPSQSNITFGVLNNLNYKDWARGDASGSGYDYSSYLISHPILAGAQYHNKTTPYLLATFKRTETGFDVLGNPIFPSACQGAVLWDWHVDGDAGKWDAQQEAYKLDQNLYRYDEETLLHCKYVSTKTRVYGSGRAFQVKLSSVEGKSFDVENIGFQLYIDGRI
jgi:hypothetical protein